MRKIKKGRKLNRRKGQRVALLKTLASSLILKERIKTTEARAKELAFYIEKKITKAKNDNLSSQRLLLRFFAPKIVKKLIKELAPRYKERKGGYTRIIKLNPRFQDAAKIAIIELVK